MLTPPKAFISHASEDKGRFVVDFATRLRSNGIDAWLDHWEIKAGDSLVDKIFEEGIKHANAFIVVVSSISVSKKWVREELDSGMVRKIEKSCRLIPVVIDTCEIPQALHHLKWVKIKDLASYDSELSEIISAILGTSEKPPLGSLPAHATATVIDYLPDLTRADNLVFGILCRHYLKTGDTFFEVNEVYDDLMSLGFSEEEIGENLEVLAGRGYIHTKAIAGGGIWGIELQSHTLDAFMRIEVKDYELNIVSIISKIVNEKQDTSDALHVSTGIALPIILNVLDLLCDRGLLEQIAPAGLPVRKITKFSPELKRMLREQNG